MSEGATAAPQKPLEIYDVGLSRTRLLTQQDLNELRDGIKLLARFREAIGKDLQSGHIQGPEVREVLKRDYIDRRERDWNILHDLVDISRQEELEKLRTSV